MKHIFRKLHHHANRTNDNPPPQPPRPPSPSCSDSAAASSAATATATAASIGAVVAPPAAVSEGNHNSVRQHQDYYASEEEYQVQLALALSASSSGGVNSLVDSGKAAIRSPQDGDAAADYLSRRYWDFGLLDFDERMVDGFYDVHNLSSDPAVRENMPSLADLDNDNGASNYELVVVNRKIDPALEELLQIAHCIALDCPTTETSLLIQRLAELVTDHLGGPVRDASIIFGKFMERRMELRASLHTVVLPIGSLRIGLSRHRALLFKALADNVGIPCRLVKGNHYTGMDDDAFNIIKLGDDSECLVDLMGAPGTLIPADILGGKDTPLNSLGTRPSSQTSIQPTSVTRDSSTHPQLNPVSGHKFSLGSTSWKPEVKNSDDGVGTSGQSEKVPLDLLDRSPSSQGIESALQRGGTVGNSSVDGMGLKLNVIPYSMTGSEDPRNVFAELNPFQVKPSGNLGGKHQFFGSSRAAGFSPAPLMWKNRHALNESPKKKSNANSEGSLYKKNQGGDDDRASTTAVSRHVKDQPQFQESSGKDVIHHHENMYSLDVPPNSYGSEPRQGGGGGSHKLLHAQSKLISDAEVFGLEDCDLVEGECTLEVKENELTRVSEYDENGQWRFTGGTGKPTDTKNASCSLDVWSNSADIDIDVGDCEIVWEDLVLGERIGLGSYGEVYRADWNGTEVAVKKFLDQDFSGAALDEFKREVRIMRRLRHPNVVLFVGAVTRPPNLSIITEFLPRGSLYRILHRPHFQIDEKRRIRMALDVAKGMNCLHTSIPTIVHRDLKSPNLLVDSNWNVKVCDFGLSRLKHNTFLSSKSTGGTPEWMAPEVLRNEPSNEKCDVYSFGVILWELATLKIPWSGMNPMQVVGAVGFQNRRLDIPKDVDPLVGRIIWECWQTDPNLRPSFAQLCVALKPLKRLAISSQVEQQSGSSSQERISIGFTTTER
ncbi:hypothetical protein M569_09459 [Genlisea aurea]|uniref:non-specific serine/threonine protein kinase n=1 Tax=Genlisea aurea TaxID=192259 RepID=S8DZ34_9LAMI|nr:hypothetical protein M569_09459 [Genlisea aurea]